jgi:hypothetical protein
MKIVNGNGILTTRYRSEQGGCFGVLHGFQFVMRNIVLNTTKHRVFSFYELTPRVPPQAAQWHLLKQVCIKPSTGRGVQSPSEGTDEIMLLGVSQLPIVRRRT